MTAVKFRLAFGASLACILGAIAGTRVMAVEIEKCFGAVMAGKKDYAAVLDTI